MKKSCLMAIVIFIFCSLFSFAETLDEILKKNYQVMGGLEKIREVKSLITKGKISINAQNQNMELPVEVKFKDPGMTRMEIELQGKKIIFGYDGKKAWMIMSMLSEDPQELPEEQSRDIKDMAEIRGPLVDYKEKGYSLEYIGKEKIEGTDTYKLKLSKKDRPDTFIFLDADSGIQIKTEVIVKKDNNQQKVEIFLGDYREVDGIMMPFHIESKSDGKTQMNLIAEKYIINEKMDDAIFAMPPKKIKPPAESAATPKKDK